MARVRAGEEVVIENGTSPAAVLRSAEMPRRSISESIALTEARIAKVGFDPVIDDKFAADMREIIAKRKPRDTLAWD